MTKSGIVSTLPLCRAVGLMQPLVARAILNLATLKIFPVYRTCCFSARMRCENEYWCHLCFKYYSYRPSSPAYLQAQSREMTRALFLSPTLPADSTEQQAARSNTSMRTLDSEETTELLVPHWERHPGWLRPPLAVGVEHAEPSTIKNSARPSLLSTPDSQHVASVSSGIISDSWLRWHSLSSVPHFQRAERSGATGGPSPSLTVRTQDAFPSFAHKPTDDPRDGTLDVHEGQPTAIGPRTRSQTRRAAENLSAPDRHSS